MLRDPTDVRYYTELFEFFRGYALQGTEAREFIMSIADDFRCSS